MEDMKARPARGKNRKFKEPFLRRARRVAWRAVWVSLTAVAVPAAIYGGILAHKKLKTTPYLAIKTINVSGAERVGRDEVVELSGLREGRNMLSFRAGEVIDSIKTNPWIETVEVRRRYLTSVEIEIKERVPSILVMLDGLYLADASGAVFKKFSHEDGVDLPVVTGLRAEAPGNGTSPEELALRGLVMVLSRRSGFNIAEVSEIHFDPAFGFSVYTLEGGVRLDLGNGNFEEKFSSFDRIVKLRGGDLADVVTMDLNNSREVVLGFTTNVEKEGGEGNGKKG